MNKDQALQYFWSSFGLNAYDELTVPDEAKAPYITYEVSTDRWDSPVMLTASLWWRSMSWVEINAKRDEIASRLANGGQVIKLDDGFLWITQGSPFSQRQDDPSDNAIRRIILNVQAEFLTAA